MVRQSGNIFEIASAICFRSNCALGFVLQYRVQYLVKCLCLTANSCKTGLLVGALRIACNGLCTAARFHSADDIPGCLLGCSEGLDCSRHYNQCPTCSAPSLLSGLVLATASLPRLCNPWRCSCPKKHFFSPQMQRPRVAIDAPFPYHFPLRSFFFLPCLQCRQ